MLLVVRYSLGLSATCLHYFIPPTHSEKKEYEWLRFFLNYIYFVVMHKCKCLLIQ